MAYATHQDMAARFGERELVELTNRDDLSADNVDRDVLARAIEDASGDIDARLDGRYPVPLPRVPDVITRIACQLARFYLYDDAAPEAVTQRYKDALKLLDKIAAGDASLGLPEHDTSSTAGQPDHAAPERVFTHDTLRRF